MKLLEHVAELIAEKGYIVENIDATIIAQKPKMRPHIEQMEKNIAAAAGKYHITSAEDVVFCLMREKPESLFIAINTETDRNMRKHMRGLWQKK